MHDMDVLLFFLCYNSGVSMVFKNQTRSDYQSTVLKKA